MNYVEHRFALDVHETVSRESVCVKKGNTAHRLLIHLTERGCPFHISPECYAVFTAKKPDGKVVFNDCTIEDCVIIYDFTPQTVAAVGLLDCEIMLYGADDTLLTSSSFRIVVEDTVYDEEKELDSQTEATALTKLISEATTLITDVEEKLENGEFVGPQGPQGEQSEVGPEEIGRIVNEYLEKNPPAAYTLPIATETTLGGVKAAAATEEMTQPVGITEDGKLVTAPGQNSGGNVEPMEDDIPKVFFGGALPQTKDDTIMSFRYVSKTADINCYCKTKAQGDSSMSYPKKNQTVKLYKDAECTKKLKVNFKGWGEQNKFCFKANWVDITHARNVVSARLWGDVVKSRSNYAELPELLRTSPNQGAIDGFPVKVYADGVYQGRYTLNIPKDAWMANMDDELDNHCILCGENAENGSSQFKAEALIDGTDWSDEIHDTVPESIKTRWNEVIRFVMNSTDEEFVENLGNYFDVPSLIDYYLFGIASCNYDGFKKNQLYYTYDGVKWYAGAYDMDLTWGNALDGTELAEHDRKWYMEYDWNRLYCRLDALFINELRERWNELKDSTLSVANVINHFERFTDICPPWLVAEDYAETTANGAFTAMPTISTIQQIRDYAKKRHAWTNAYLGGHDFGCLMVYELNNTELNGTYGIDTGVNLNAMNAYTVLIDYTMHNIETQSYILDNANNSSGWWMQYSPAVKFGAFGAGTTGVVEAMHPWATQDPTGIRTKVMVRKTADGQYTFRSSDMESAHFANFTEKFGENDPGQNLWIGGNYYGQGVVNSLANAKIHDCKVYDVALTDDKALEYLNG